MSRRRKWMFRLALMGMAVVFSLVIAEVGLRIVRGKNLFYPHHKNMTFTSYPQPDIMPGVEDPAYFSTNSHGCRGPEFADEKIRLLVVGGSTAICKPLDDTEEWAHLVMEGVNEKLGAGTVWVTNSGIDGKNTRHHIMHARHLLPRLGDMDFVLYYCGLNDLGSWLYDENYDPKYLEDPLNEEQIIAEAFRVSGFTSKELPFYKHLELWKVASQVKNAIESRDVEANRDAGRIVEDEMYEWLREQQEFRAKMEAELVPRAKQNTLPDALGEYRRNLESMIELTRKVGAEPVFMTQFTAWDQVDEEAKNRFWMGQMNGGTAVIEPQQFQLLMDRYNEVMKDVAAAHQIRIIDLPPALATIREAATYDGCHFTELGAREVARVVTDALLPVLEKHASSGD